jgi:hypothetical protein
MIGTLPLKHYFTQVRLRVNMGSVENYMVAVDTSTPYVEEWAETGVS